MDVGYITVSTNYKTKDEIDIDISMKGNNLNIFSLKQIKKIDLYDQCGRLVLVGNRITDHKFSFSINFDTHNYLAFFIRVLLPDGSYFKRVNI